MAKTDARARAEAMDVAEGAREATRTKPSFAAELFMGRFPTELVYPFPEQSPEDRARAEGFLEDLARVLREKIDPDRVDREGDLPPGALEALHEVGAFRMKMPPEHGGMGFSQMNYNRAAALAGSWCASTSIWLGGHQSIGVPTPLMLFGTPEQKARFLPRLASGALSAFALTEPEVGSDPARMRLTATPTEDGTAYVLNGEKLWCTNGAVGELLVVMARTPDQVVRGRPRKQISAFIVETSTPGFEVAQRCRFMGFNGIQNAFLRFRDVRVPRENLLWGEGQGLKLAFITLNTGRLTLPAANTAVAKQCLRIVRHWAATRQQWGAPVGRHEAVAVMVGWIASHTFAMEAVSDYATALADGKETDIRLEAAIAKLFCSEVGCRIADLTLQVRGGRGYETESSLRARGEVPFPVERIYREARLNTIIEGSSELLRLFLAREALDPHYRRGGALVRPGAPFRQKAWSFLKAAAYYPGWYAKRWLPTFGTPSGIPRPLRGHWRWARRGARRLARRIFYAIVRHGAGLEHRQALLGRIVDEGTDLLAMSVSIARAASRADAPSAELADLFCRHARRRVRQGYGARLSLDRAGSAVGHEVLEGRYRAQEDGIVPYEGVPGLDEAQGGAPPSTSESRT